MKKPGWLILCLLVALAVILVALGVFYRLLNNYSENVYEVGLPLLAIIGVICLLAVLTFVSIAFSSMNLADKSQALALPDGSVRAVIALSLIVIFAITSIFFYTKLADRSISVASFDTSAKSDEFATSLQSGELVARRGPAPAAPAPGAPAPAAPDPYPFKVYFRANGNQSSDDFAKQVLTMIGTLVTAVSSFYFGSKAAAGGSKSAAAPVLMSVKPTSATAGGGPQELDMTGSGLQLASNVSLVKGEQQVAATNVVSSDNLLKSTIALANLSPGTWDVVVNNSDGQSARLPGAFTVNPAGTPPAATPPLPKSVVPPSAKKGGDPQTLKIAGVGLQAVNSVRMVQGETKVAATQVEPSDILVSCTIALTSDLPTGLWDIVVETSDGQTAKLPGAFSVTA